MPLNRIAGDFQNLNGHPARFKPAGHILNEPRLPLVGDSHPGDPAEKREELAPVAHTQRKGIGTMIKIVKHLPQPFIEPDRCRPPFGAFRNIGIRESSHRNESPETLQGDSSADQIGHRDIPRPETCLIKSGGHLAVAVASLFPENGDLRFVFGFKKMRRRRSGLKEMT